MQTTRYSGQIVIKSEFSRQSFEKSWNVKFQETEVQWKPSCYTRKDGQREVIVAFCSSAKAPKTSQLMLYIETI